MVECYVSEYMENKSILNGLIEKIRLEGKPNSEILYRGDCMYSSAVKVGNTFRLHNVVASFTSCKLVAKTFSNTRSAPDWYYEEGEWNRDYDYPFKDYIRNNEELVPVVLVIDKNSPVCSFCTDGYNKRFNEHEHIILTDDLLFKIVDIKGDYIKCEVDNISLNNGRNMDMHGFRNKYDFLSNMYDCSINYEGIEFKSSESLFQGLKDESQLERFSKYNGKKAKKEGKKVKLPNNWEDIKVERMMTSVLLKFSQNEDLKEKLLNTPKEAFVEYNTWCDNYWGVCKCKKCKGKKGENVLGKMLEQLQNYLK